MKTFKDLGLNDFLLNKISKKGFRIPSDIQIKVIPLLLNGNFDIIGQAQTGSGKTAAFVLPILQKINPQNNQIQALILTPTRELAIQIANEIISFANSNIKIQLLYGGQSISKEIYGLKKKPHIIVGTTGRILDHLLKRKTLKLDTLKYLILDEADEMLNMGFIEDIKKILQNTPKNKQILLFSATMPQAIQNIAMKYLKNTMEIKIQKKHLTNPNIKQTYYIINQHNKFDILVRLLGSEPDFYGIVFCKTKADVDKISSKLNQYKFKAEGLHGDISQNLREKTLRRFKRKNIKILVATDVAARGIDVNNLTHVINYTLPNNPESYIHRIGRTGRAGNKGEAISLITRNQLKKINLIEKTTKSKITLGELPDINELIQIKKKKLINNILKQLKTNQLHYLSIAIQLLKLDSPEKILAAILQEVFGNEYISLNNKLSRNPKNKKTSHKMKKKNIN